MDFWTIYDQHYAKARKFILSYVKDESTADDLVQECFSRIMEKLSTVKEPEKLSAWIFRIAYNLCHDHFRHGAKAQLDDDLLKFISEKQSVSSPQKELEILEMGNCVQDQMDKLSDSYKLVLVLYDMMDLSQQEIAEILEIEVGAVKQRLHRARKKMKEILEKECQFETDERGVLVCDLKTRVPDGKNSDN